MTMTLTRPTVSAEGRHATAMALRFRRNPTCPEAWRRLQESMEGLVRREAKRQYRPDPGYDLDDLISAGYDGVHEAAVRFDRRRRKSFTTYAPYRIWRSITRRRVLMSEAIHLPSNVRSEIRAWRKAGRPENPTVEALERLMDRPPSLDAPGDGSGWDQPAASASAIVGTIAREEFVWIRGLLAQVAEYDPRAVVILGRRFGLDGSAETQAEIAASLNISKTRLQQIEARAMRHIRKLADGRRPRLCA